MVAILQAPGRLLALDNPVALKTTLGRGFTVSVNESRPDLSLLATLQQDAPAVTNREFRGKQLYLTGSTDIELVRKLVEKVSLDRSTNEHDYGFQVNSASLEEVFLDLNAEKTPSSSTTPSLLVADGSSADGEKELEGHSRASAHPAIGGLKSAPLSLSPGRHRHPLAAVFIDAWTIVRKRLIVLRRAWLMPLIAIVIVLAAVAIPLFFLDGRVQTCAFTLRQRRSVPFTYPYSAFPFAFTPVVIAPSDAFNVTLPPQFVVSEPDNASFVDYFSMGYTNSTGGGISFGGISVSDAASTGAPLFAFEGTPLLNKGLSALNLLSNALFDRIVGGRNSLTNAFGIFLNFQALPAPSFTSTAQAFKWIGFA